LNYLPLKTFNEFIKDGNFESMKFTVEYASEKYLEDVKREEARKGEMTLIK